MSNYEFHEIANWLPMLDHDGLQKMAEDIKSHGQRLPIILYDGKILDGRNRYVACQMAGVPPVYQDLPEGEDPVAYAESMNLPRRHLTVSQLAMYGDNKRAYYDRQAKEKYDATVGRPSKLVETVPPISEKVKARDQAGAAVGVSGRTMDKAKKVREQGHKNLVKAVESGKLDVTKAAKLAELPKDVQETILEDAERLSWSGRQMLEEAKRLNVTPFEAPATVDESELTGDSYNLQQLKHYWRKTSRKDKKEFLRWTETAGRK